MRYDVTGLVWVVLLVTACTALTDSVHRGDALELTGEAMLVADAADRHSLAVEVLVSNRGDDQVSFTVLSYCPVVVQLRAAEAGTAEVAYTTADRPCPRAGRTIQLDPGSQALLEWSIPVTEIRAAGISTGTYLAEGIVRVGDVDLIANLGVVEIR